MKTKIFATAILQFLIISILNAQPTQEWVARYDGPVSSWDNANSIAVDGSGNVYVTGWSDGSGTSEDYATIKYNSAGVQQWVSRYNGPGNSRDEAMSIAVDGSGNVYVTGSSKSGATYGTEDYATIKYNSTGVQQWVQRYNGPGDSTDIAPSIAVDGSGNVYVTGWSYGSGTYDYATIKYSTTGVQQWVQRYDGPVNGSDGARSIALDISGNVYVTGWSRGGGTAWDYTTIKYNSAGIEQWVARYNGPVNGNNVAMSIAVDGSGNVYVTGSSEGSGTYDDYATIKYNSSGIEQWVARYNGPVNGPDYASSIAIDASGNVYVTGISYGSVTYSDYATIKYSQLPTGVPEQITKNASLNLYPNPASDVVSLTIDNTNNADLTLNIYNVIGELIRTEKLLQYHQQINIGDLRNGIYMVEIKSKEWAEKQKLLIQR